MKKTLVALAVAAVAATSANAAVVYNQDGTKVEAGGSLRLVLVKATDKRMDLNDNSSRLKFKGTHELGEGLSALGYAELGFKGDLGEDGLKTRRLYAGFEHKDIGLLTFGKQLTNADAFGVSDPTYKFGGVWAAFNGSTLLEILDVYKGVLPNGLTKEEIAKEINNFKDDRSAHFLDAGDKVIHFTSKSFNGFSFGADYLFGNSDKNKARNDAYILGLFYDNTFDGVNVKAEAGYTHQNINKDKKAKSFKLALGAGYEGFFLGADYAQTKVSYSSYSMKVKAFQIGADYDFTDMTKVYAAYRHTKSYDDGIKTKDVFDGVKEKGYALGVGHKLHKQVETFLEYNTFKSNVENAKRDNKVYAGLRVHF